MVELDKIDTRQAERIERDLLDGDCFVRRIVDRLADELGIGARLEFQAAEARRQEIIRTECS